MSETPWKMDTVTLYQTRKMSPSAERERLTAAVIGYKPKK